MHTCIWANKQVVHLSLIVTSVWCMYVHMNISCAHVYKDGKFSSVLLVVFQRHPTYDKMQTFMQVYIGTALHCNKFLTIYMPASASAKRCAKLTEQSTPITPATTTSPKELLPQSRSTPAVAHSLPSMPSWHWRPSGETCPVWDQWTCVASTCPSRHHPDSDNEIEI